MRFLSSTCSTGQISYPKLISSWLNHLLFQFLQSFFPWIPSRAPVFFKVAPGDPHGPRRAVPAPQVQYLQLLDQETLVAVARKLTPQLFAPHEAIEKQSASAMVASMVIMCGYILYMHVYALSYGISCYRM